MKIYVAGPYSAPTEEETLANVQKCINVARVLIILGHNPYVPHLSHYVDEGVNFGYDKWMVLTEEWLRCCDALYQVAPSPGAERELVLAEELGKPVYLKLEEVPWN